MKLVGYPNSYELIYLDYFVNPGIYPIMDHPLFEVGLPFSERVL
jgi:hypothetical protein